MLKKILRKFYACLEKLEWKSFESVGTSAPHHSWYYAGKKLYIVRTGGSFFLTRAESPAEALANLKYSDLL